MDSDLWWERNNRIAKGLLWNSKNMVVALLKENGEILDCNDGCLRLLGLAGKPVGRPLKDFLQPEQSDRVALERIIDSKRMRLHFVQKPAVVHVLEAEFVRSEGAFLLFGEKLMLTNNDVVSQMTVLYEELVNLNRRVNKEKAALERARSRIRTLEGILPICMHCHKIRDDEDTWGQLETYITEHSDAHFSHGICPSCMALHYPDEAAEK